MTCPGEVHIGHADLSLNTKLNETDRVSTAGNLFAEWECLRAVLFQADMPRMYYVVNCYADLSHFLFRIFIPI